MLTRGDFDGDGPQHIPLPLSFRKKENIYLASKNITTKPNNHSKAKQKKPCSIKFAVAFVYQHW